MPDHTFALPAFHIFLAWLCSSGYRLTHLFPLSAVEQLKIFKKQNWNI